MTVLDQLTAASPAARIGLGLAAVGRPGYFDLRRDSDLPDRSVAALRTRTHELLDEAYACGVRYLDVARSYGRAEEFLAEWLTAQDSARSVVVGSKWGYTYVADWRARTDVHEVKDHGVAAFDRQFAETRALLGTHLNVYQVHSVTPESTVLTDTTLHRRLSALAAQGITVGLSTSGPGQSEAIRAALETTVNGAPLFRSVQATWNPLEPSAAAALAEARAAGCTVIVKEALANGRLAGRQPGEAPAVLAEVADELATTGDAVALAAALHQPWATIVLSGATTVAQLRSNLKAATLTLNPDQLDRLGRLAEPAQQYWHHRSSLAWA